MNGTSERVTEGQVAREDVTSRELAVTAETQVATATASAVAEVQARYAIAKKFPRIVGQVRAALLEDCKRPRFAEVARYALPRGKCKECKGSGCTICDGTGKHLIRGWTIRFAEAAMRALTNVDARHVVTYDSPQKRAVTVRVLDLETNTAYASEFVFEKTVERRFADKGQHIISQRKNSYGETVYVVHATDEEVAVKQASLVSKAIRTLLLRIVPGDLLDEALDEVEATLAAGDKAVDPAAERKKLEDAFLSLGVTPAMLAERLGHPVEACTPGERKLLRGVYTALKTGETTWAEVAKPDEDLPPRPEEKKTPSSKESVGELRAQAKEGPKS